MWIERTTFITAYRFPGILKWFEVKSVSVVRSQLDALWFLFSVSFTLKKKRKKKKIVLYLMCRRRSVLWRTPWRPWRWPMKSWVTWCSSKPAIARCPSTRCPWCSAASLTLLSWAASPTTRRFDFFCLTSQFFSWAHTYTDKDRQGRRTLRVQSPVLHCVCLELSCLLNQGQVGSSFIRNKPLSCNISFFEGVLRDIKYPVQSQLDKTVNKTATNKQTKTKKE